MPKDPLETCHCSKGRCSKREPRVARLHSCKPDHDHRVHDHDNNKKEKQFKLIHLFKGDGCGLKIIVVTEFIIISYHIISGILYQGYYLHFKCHHCRQYWMNERCDKKVLSTWTWNALDRNKIEASHLTVTHMMIIITMQRWRPLLKRWWLVK